MFDCLQVPTLVVKIEGFMKGSEQSWSHLKVNFLNHKILLENHVGLLYRQIVVDFTTEYNIKIVLKVVYSDCRQIIDIGFDPSALEPHIIAVLGRASEVNVRATREPEVKYLVFAWGRIKEGLQCFATVGDYQVKSILNHNLNTLWQG